MVDTPVIPDKPDVKAAAAKAWESIKVDYGIIRVIVLTAAAVFALLMIPMLWMLTHFVTFDQLDAMFKVSESMRPKILDRIPEEIEAGYAKNFFVDNSHTDDPMIFAATAGQHVTLTIDVSSYQGLTVQPVQFQLNGQCTIDPLGDESHVSAWDLSPTFQKCKPREINTLRIVVPSGLKKGIKMQVQCVLLVGQKIHDPLARKG